MVFKVFFNIEELPKNLQQLLYDYQNLSVANCKCEFNTECWNCKNTFLLNEDNKGEIIRNYFLKN